GIRDKLVTGVQTCALPILQCHELYHSIGQCQLPHRTQIALPVTQFWLELNPTLLVQCFEKLRCKKGIPLGFLVYQLRQGLSQFQIGRASCRERVEIWVREE